MIYASVEAELNETIDNLLSLFRRASKITLGTSLHACQRVSPTYIADKQ